MEQLGRDQAKKFFERYRSHRTGIRKVPEMASVCLICGSPHIGPQEGDPHQLVCRNCGFAFFRYDCPVCGEAVDGRDPANPGCPECGLRVCSCGACDCARSPSPPQP